MSLLTRTIAAATVGSFLAVPLAGGAARATPRAVAPANLSLSEVQALLPPASQLPGHLRVRVNLKSTGRVFDSPCPASLAAPASAPYQSRLLQGGAADAIYPNGRASASSAIPYLWSITAVVFHSPVKARSAMAEVMKVEKACPRIEVGDASKGTPTVTRTSGARYVNGGWTGYRSIDHIVGGPAFEKGRQGDRFISVYLTRGNVLLRIGEQAASVPGSGPRQDAWSKAVVRLVLARFNAAR